MDPQPTSTTSVPTLSLELERIRSLVSTFISTSASWATGEACTNNGFIVVTLTRITTNDRPGRLTDTRRDEAIRIVRGFCEATLAIDSHQLNDEHGIAISLRLNTAPPS